MGTGVELVPPRELRCGEAELDGDVRGPLTQDEIEDIPNGGYGWVCVACVFWICAHTWGINSAYGIFLAFYLTNSTFPSASPLEFAFIGGLSVSQCLLVSPLTTLITRLTNTRTTLSIGVVLQTAGLVGASFATEIWHLFLSQGLCFGWGMGFLYVGSAGIIPQWFSTRRSLANGITAAGVGVGGLIYNLATSAMIQKIGLASTFRVLAGCSFIVNTICTILVRDRNKLVLPNQHPFDVRLLSQPQLLLSLGWGFFSQTGYVILWFSMPAYAQSIGQSAQQGSIVGAMINLGTCVGRPAVGYLSDSIGRLNVATLVTALCGIMCLLMWTFSKSFEVLCVFAAIVGLVCGTFWSTVVPVTAEIVGLRDVPSALSVTFLIMVLPSTFAEPIALKLRRDSGNIYLDAQLFTGFSFVIAALCSWVLRSWKIVSVQQQAIATREREVENKSKSKQDRKMNLTATKKLWMIVKNLVEWKRV